MSDRGAEKEPNGPNRQGSNKLLFVRYLYVEFSDTNNEIMTVLTPLFWVTPFF